MAIRSYSGRGGGYVVYFKYHGKQYSKVVKTKAEGKQWEVEEKKRLKAMSDLQQILTYSQACRDYLLDCEVRMTKGTFQEKQSHFREFARYLQRDVAMEEITPMIAKRYMLVMQENHGNKAANRRLRNFKALWNWLKGQLNSNPWKDIRNFPEEEHIKYVPPREDMERVLSLAEQWERDFLEVLLHSGARVGEVMQLTWEDIGPKTMQLWTRKRKNGSRQRRIIPLDSRLRQIFANMREKTQTQKFVFINPQTGAPYHRLQPSIRYMLKRLCTAAGVKQFGFHAIRHYFALRLMETHKTGLTEIQLLLGHQRATTTDAYLKSMSLPLDFMAELIEEAVMPTQGNNKPRQG